MELERHVFNLLYLGWFTEEELYKLLSNVDEERVTEAIHAVTHALELSRTRALDGVERPVEVRRSAPSQTPNR